MNAGPERSPQLRLDVAALDHNIATMNRWCAGYGVELAPHVKTSMSPQVVARQLAAGAAGVTVATPGQAVLAARWGAREVLVANEVVTAHGLRTLREAPELDGVAVGVFADSAAGVAAAAAVHTDPGRALGVLVDVGTGHRGRTGVRDTAAALAVADAVTAAPGLRLLGVAGYEGVVVNDRDPAVLDAVDRHCARVAEVFALLRGRCATDRPVFSMGGSAFPDRVMAALPDPAAGPVRVLLRSGCYVTHDHGTYAGVSPVAGLVPALTVRTTVVSAPEPGLVVLDAGKRDLPHDAGPPVVPDRPGLTVRTLYDHHAVLVGDTAGLAVGDAVDLGVSHPCSAFDRWPRFRAVGARDDGGDELWDTDFRRDPG